MRRTELEMGLISPRGKYVHVYINGEYWGVYDLHERPNEDFFADHAGGRPEDYDVLHHPEFSDEEFALKSGSDTAWVALLDLAGAGISDEAQYQAIQELLDVDGFITSMISRIWSGDYDWCGPIFEDGFNRTAFDNKNWYAGRRSRDGTSPFRGKFQFFSWDAEMSMGLHLKSNLGLDHPQRELDFDLTGVADPGSPAAIYNALRSYSEFQIRFADLLQRHLFDEGAMSPANNRARLAAIESEIENAMIAESARWGDEGSADAGDVFDRDDEWRAEVNWLKNVFVQSRNPIIINQFRSNHLFPSVSAPAFGVRGGEVPVGFRLNLSGSGGTIYYTTDGSDPRLVGGGINPNARIYTGPITVSGPSTIVRARLRAPDANWSALDEATFIVGQAASADNLSISEFHYHPAEPRRPEELAISAESRDYEFVEIANTSDSIVTLTDIEFVQGISFKVDPAKPIQELPAGGRVLVVRNREAFLARYGESLDSLIVGSFADDSKLSNNGENLTLVDAGGEPISSFSYSDSAPWPTAADGYGRSLELRDPTGSTDPSLPASWRPSIVRGGTPGLPAITNYSEWIAVFFDPDAPDFDALAAPENDPDADGLSNAIEYWLAGSPSNPVADRPIAAKLVTILGQTYAAAEVRSFPGLDDVTATVQASTDLVGWSSENITTSGFPAPQPDGTEIVTFRLSTVYDPGVPVYLRLVIELDTD